MQHHESIEILPLILAGGKSTRMGYPKHLLQFPNGTSLLQRTVDLLQVVCSSSKVYISMAQDTSKDATTTALLSSVEAELIHDLEANHTTESLGPAAGLLAAHRRFPQATWLVVACDFPLLTTETIRRLCETYSPPVTCYQNQHGHHEPLLAIWSPHALSRLEENVRAGRQGPNFTIKQLEGLTLAPPAGLEHWLLNANTKEEWNEALRIAAADL